MKVVKKHALLCLIVSIVATINIFAQINDAQPKSEPPGANAPTITSPPATGGNAANAQVVKAQSDQTQSLQNLADSRATLSSQSVPPVQTFATQLAPPQDIASLNAKEILSQNSQAVASVAQMYQHLGLFITLIVSIVGAVAVWMNYLSRRNVQDFVTQWNERLVAIEADLKASVRSANDAIVKSNEAIGRANDATGRAASSAADAAAKATEIKDHQQILDKALSDLRHTNYRVTVIEEQLIQRLNPITDANPITETADKSAQVPDDSLNMTPAETDQITAKLHGKLSNLENEIKK